MSIKLWAITCGATILSMAAASAMSLAAEWKVNVNDEQRDELPLIVRRALERLGTRVGNGTSTEFVDEVLREAGCRARVDFRDSGDTQTHAWGKPVVNEGKYPRHVFPKAGDVLQFEDCIFGVSDAPRRLPHNAAIVKEASLFRVTLIHQDPARGGRVVESVIELGTRKQGSYRIYRPIKL